MDNNPQKALNQFVKTLGIEGISKKHQVYVSANDGYSTLSDKARALCERKSVKP